MMMINLRGVQHFMGQMWNGKWKETKKEKMSKKNYYKHFPYYESEYNNNRYFI